MKGSGHFPPVSVACTHVHIHKHIFISVLILVWNFEFKFTHAYILGSDVQLCTVCLFINMLYYISGLAVEKYVHKWFFYFTESYGCLCIVVVYMYVGFVRFVGFGLVCLQGVETSLADKLLMTLSQFPLWVNCLVCMFNLCQESIDSHISDVDQSEWILTVSLISLLLCYDAAIVGYLYLIFY